MTKLDLSLEYKAACIEFVTVGYAPILALMSFLLASLPEPQTIPVQLPKFIATVITTHSGWVREVFWSLDPESNLLKNTEIKSAMILNLSLIQTSDVKAPHLFPLATTCPLQLAIWHNTPLHHHLHPLPFPFLSTSSTLPFTF